MVLGYLCAYLLTKVYIGIQKNLGFQILPCDDVDDASTTNYLSSNLLLQFPTPNSSNCIIFPWNVKSHQLFTIYHSENLIAKINIKRIYIGIDIYILIYYLSNIKCNS